MFFQYGPTLMVNNVFLWVAGRRPAVNYYAIGIALKCLSGMSRYPHYGDRRLDAMRRRIRERILQYLTEFEKQSQNPDLRNAHNKSIII